jgi:putative ABC transport system permease protein
VLGFTLAVSILTGLIFGMIPIVKYAGVRVASSIRAGGRTLSASRERNRVRNVLAAVQIALAMVLLIGSGLMIRTFQALRRVDPGFVRPAELLTLRIFIPEAQVSDPGAAIHMEQSILDRIAAIPGVRSAGISTRIPMDGGGWTDSIYAEDRTHVEGQIPPLKKFKFVSPGLIGTMGNRLVAGRDFTWTDHYDRRTNS